MKKRITALLLAAITVILCACSTQQAGSLPDVSASDTDAATIAPAETEPDTTAEPETLPPEPEVTEPETTVPETEPETEPETTVEETTVAVTTAEVTTVPETTAKPKPSGPIAVQAVTIDAEKLTLNVGESHTLKLGVIPADATDQKLTVTLASGRVAGISGATITAKAAGVTTITVSSANGKSVSCMLVVVDPAVPDHAEHFTAIDADISLTTTKTPRPSGKSTVRSGTIIVAGSTEENAVLTVTGTNIEPMTVTPQGKRFFFQVKLKRDQTDTLYISARVDGQRTSSLAKIDIKYERANKDVYAGKNSQLHYPATLPDYYGNNLWGAGEIKKVERTIESRLNRVREASGKDTVLIYLIAPNALTVYPETALDEWAEDKVSDNSRLLQLAEIIEAREGDDVIMINLPEYLKSKRDVGKLYYQTDTHWNTLGAYFGYYQLMSAIAEKYPNCKPHELSDFTITTNTTRVGDLLNFSQLGGALAETNTECHKNFKTATSSLPGLTGEGGTTHVNDDSLPSAVIMRDSFGSAIYSFMAEHFSTMTFTPYNGGLTNALNYVKSVQPDYFIQILVERNIGGLLSE